MVPMRPLPVAQQPVAGANAANQVYWQYWQVLDQVIRALVSYGINKQASSVTGYHLQITDVASIVEMTSSSANTITIDPDNTTSLPIGSHIKIVQAGTGATTIVAGTGVTLHSHLGDQLAAQWSVAEIYKRGPNEWVAIGDLT